MSARVFLDTNVIVYAFDDRDRSKQARAWRLLEAAGQSGRALISTQVLQEFYVVVTRKLERPLPEEEAERAIRLLARLPVVQVDRPMVLAAARMSRQERLSLWDALIVQAAIEGDCAELLSEDLHPGRRFGSLAVRPPFQD